MLFGNVDVCIDVFESDTRFVLPVFDRGRNHLLSLERCKCPGIWRILDSITLGSSG